MVTDLLNSRIENLLKRRDRNSFVEKTQFQFLNLLNLKILIFPYFKETFFLSVPGLENEPVTF
jgi:hypothetical protein